MGVPSAFVTLMSSPRAWGCFYGEDSAFAVEHVFPTGVGMFLDFFDETPEGDCLPHGRGDVSHIAR